MLVLFVEAAMIGDKDLYTSLPRSVANREATLFAQAQACEAVRSEMHVNEAERTCCLELLRFKSYFEAAQT